MLARGVGRGGVVASEDVAVQRRWLVGAAAERWGSGGFQLTHDVLNQSVPLADVNMFTSDAVLSQAVEKLGGGWAADTLAGVIDWLGEPTHLSWACWLISTAHVSSVRSIWQPYRLC